MDSQAQDVCRTQVMAKEELNQDIIMQRKQPQGNGKDKPVK